MTPLWRVKQTTQERYDPSYKQLGIKTDRTSYLYGNRNGLHNKKLRTSRNNSTPRWTPLRVKIK